ncbi:hypothetical protein TgHK011_002611 [Trichoderma gracile]|nr:hypothetical protein TgHK011_002611 [Trichoderma gracile]
MLNGWLSGKMLILEASDGSKKTRGDDPRGVSRGCQHEEIVDLLLQQRTQGRRLAGRVVTKAVLQCAKATTGMMMSNDLGMIGERSSAGALARGDEVLGR